MVPQVPRDAIGATIIVLAGGACSTLDSRAYSWNNTFSRYVEVWRTAT